MPPAGPPRPPIKPQWLAVFCGVARRLEAACHRRQSPHRGGLRGVHQHGFDCMAHVQRLAWRSSMGLGDKRDGCRHMGHAWGRADLSHASLRRSTSDMRFNISPFRLCSVNFGHVFQDLPLSPLFGSSAHTTHATFNHPLRYHEKARLARQAAWDAQLALSAALGEPVETPAIVRYKADKRRRERERQAARRAHRETEVTERHEDTPMRVKTGVPPPSPRARPQQRFFTMGSSTAFHTSLQS